MGGSQTTNILVYTHNVGSPVMWSIGFKPPIGNSSKNLFEVYTPIGGSPHSFPRGVNTFWRFGSLNGLHSNGWFTNYPCIGLRTLWRFA